MKNTLITLGLLCSSLLALPALAQGTAPTSTITTTTTAPAGLYQALGETAGITRLMDDFVNRLLIDPRIGGHFKDAKPQPLKDSLTRQICQLSGGPCQYTGPDMKVPTARWTSPKPTSTHWSKCCKRRWMPRASPSASKTACWRCWPRCSATSSRYGKL